jgi:ZIP family zinc transporter
LESLFPGYLLSIAAASATFFGLLVAIKRELSEKALAIALLLVAGAMLAVSLGQILPASFSNANANWQVFLAFSIGVLIVLTLAQVNLSGDVRVRTLTITLFAVTLHNFPEGATTIGATLVDLDTGITTAIVIALHNIPEGIAIAMMAKFAGLKPLMIAILVSVSAAAEVLGATVVLYFGGLIDQNLTSLLLALVAGIMTAVSFKELIPHSARVLLSRSRQSQA